MTRPVGKSPARSRLRTSQLCLNQDSFIDVSAEDDSLLPGKGVASPQARSLTSLQGTSPFKSSSVKTLASIQEDRPESAEQQAVDREAQDELMLLHAEDPSVKKKKKKKSGFNLRKSLAWNNAFFTEEGVLDPDELSLVNRTFKTQTEETKPASMKKPTLASKILNSSTAISKFNFSPIRPQKPGESKYRCPAPCSPLATSGNTSKRTNQQYSGLKGSTGGKFSIGSALSRTKEETKNAKGVSSSRIDSQIPKPALLNRPADCNSKINSEPVMQARFSSKPPINHSKHVQSISSTLSSASRMMKDRLGLVFAGRTGKMKTGTRHTVGDDTVLASNRVPEYSDSAKVTRCFSHSSYERFGNSAVAELTQPFSSTANGPTTASQSKAWDLQENVTNKGILSTCDAHTLSQGDNSCSMPSHRNLLETKDANTRDTGALDKDTLVSRVKPSGLRMPSPKLGYFDKVRTTSSSNIAVLRERTNGLGYVGAAQLPASISGYGAVPQVKYNGATQLPADIQKQNKSSDISSQARSSAPTQSDLVLQSRFSGTSSEISKHSDSHGHIPQALGSITTQSTVSRQISAVKPPLPTKKLSYPHLENVSKVDGPSCISNVHHVLGSYSMPEASLPSTKGTDIRSSGPTEVSVLPNPGPSSTLSATLSTQTSGTGSVFQAKKNAQNDMPIATRIADKLNLSPLEIIDQGKLPSEHPQTLRDTHCASPRSLKSANEGDDNTMDVIEEWPETKSGAVQHSPTHKEPPKYGPWSPVRRNAPELGPFDCTKYTNTTAVVRLQQ
ncbi:hypothetical protein KP509_05G025400 [Ceratopteris richardii]|uniref:Uncharacterized protein n=1 Tax=Ceratopteris richardii TaxID=49495 RepID=A0A8T2URN2_CERRI|nr:hypothetical protein KP509_05G025400 [Ceratopteris richardii]